jgi:hypothetical protein
MLYPVVGAGYSTPCPPYRAQPIYRSSEKLPGQGASPDQKMLFNEAEVLAAIEAAGRTGRGSLHREKCPHPT